MRTHRAALAGSWNRHKILLAILFLSLITRVAAIVHLGDRALEYSSDSKAYNDIAVNLVERGRYVTTIDPPHTLEKPYANRPPITPWLLAGIYEVFGPVLRLGQLALALLGVAACFLTYRVGSEVFGNSVGLWAAVLGALNPLWTLFAAVPLTESAAIFLYPMLVLCSLRLLKRPTVGNAILVGLVFGANALNKATILGFLPLWMIWAGLTLAPQWRRAIVVTSTAVLVCIAVLVPWTVRNYHQFGRVIPVTLQAGHSMFEANNPYTDYALKRVENGLTWLNDPRIYEPLAGFSGETQTEFDDSSRALAVQFIHQHPGVFLGFALRRLRVFWLPYANTAHRIFWYLVLPLFGIGLLLAWRTAPQRWRPLTLLCLLILQTMSLVIFFPSMPRYRAPIEPFVMILAGFSLSLAVSEVKHRFAVVSPRAGA